MDELGWTLLSLGLAGPPGLIAGLLLVLFFVERILHHRQQGAALRAQVDQLRLLVEFLQANQQGLLDNNALIIARAGELLRAASEVTLKRLQDERQTILHLLALLEQAQAGAGDRPLLRRRPAMGTLGSEPRSGSSSEDYAHTQALAEEFERSVAAGRAAAQADDAKRPAAAGQGPSWDASPSVFSRSRRPEQTKRLIP